MKSTMTSSTQEVQKTSQRTPRPAASSGVPDAEKPLPFDDPKTQQYHEFLDANQPASNPQISGMPDLQDQATPHPTQVEEDRLQRERALQPHPDDTYTHTPDPEALPTRLPELIDNSPILQLLEIEQALETQDFITNRFNQTVDLYQEAHNSLNQNREDLESAIRSISSPIDLNHSITHPDDHLPSPQSTVTSPLYNAQSNLISSNTLALLKADSGR